MKKFLAFVLIACMAVTVSACASRGQRISYVLTEMGISRQIASKAIRVSFSSFSTMQEVVSFCEKVSLIHQQYSLN